MCFVHMKISQPQTHNQNQLEVLKLKELVSISAEVNSVSELNVWILKNP